MAVQAAGTDFVDAVLDEQQHGEVIHAHGLLAG